MSGFITSPGVSVYVRSLDRVGPVFRTFARVTRVTYRNEAFDVLRYEQPGVAGPGRTWLDLELTSDGRYLSPASESDVPLIDRLALAVLHGEEDAVYPLIDEFLLSRRQ